MQPQIFPPSSYSPFRTLFKITAFNAPFILNKKLYTIFTRGAGGRAASVPSLSEVVLMSTYEELQLIISVALLIVAILTYTHKK